MNRQEYEKELKCLYDLALAGHETALALDILERGREVNLEDIRPPLEVPER